MKDWLTFSQIATVAAQPLLNFCPEFCTAVAQLKNFRLRYISQIMIQIKNFYAWVCKPKFAMQNIEKNTQKTF